MVSVGIRGEGQRPATTIAKLSVQINRLSIIV